MPRKARTSRAKRMTRKWPEAKTSNSHDFPMLGIHGDKKTAREVLLEHSMLREESPLCIEPLMSMNCMSDNAWARRSARISSNSRPEI